MAEITFDLNDVQDFDDVQLTDANDYNDAKGPGPLTPGNYRFIVSEAKRPTNKDGEPLDDNGYPQIQLDKVTIVQPPEMAGRDIFLFQKYSLRPVAGGQRKGSVPVVDLLRGFDDTLTFSNGKEALQLLLQQISSGKSFAASSSWLGKDSTYIKEQAEEAGGNLSDLSDEARKAVFQKAFFRGPKAFKDGKGGFLTEVTGPSGEPVQARTTLSRIYPASKEPKVYGPYGAKDAKKAS